MRKVLIAFIALGWLFSACHKEEAPALPTTPLPNAWEGPQSYGWVKGSRDGQDWIGSSNASLENADGTQVGFAFHTFDADTMFIEELGFVRIPLKVGKYWLTNSATSLQSIYWIGYFDETDAFYEVENNSNSYLWIDSYDPATKLITGRFQAFYEKTRNTLFNYPEFVNFTDGTFSVKLY